MTRLDRCDECGHVIYHRLTHKRHHQRERERASSDSTEET